MKTHRPWRPRVSSDPLFNPFAPATERTSILDRIEIEEEEEEREGGEPTGSAAEQADDNKTS
ncbi:MAG: hypothetical protein E6K52_08890 [Gammaproteobacteria bacterium]|nr:MAG: hypothetical protein E6K52_08890 [Gammaproteobacteria bacterium]